MDVLKEGKIHPGTVLTLIFIACILQASYGQKVCTNNDGSPCKCNTTEGLIDLSPLDNPNQPGNPTFYQIRASDGSGYYTYNPCTVFILNPPPEINGCDGDVLGCMQPEKDGQAYALGKPEPATWSKNGQGEYIVTLTATDMWDYQTRTMIVTLTCNPNAENPTFAPSQDKSSEQLTYPITLMSKYACPSGHKGPPGSGGLSVGSILCIIFFSLIMVYLIGGCVHNYYRKGARGREIIPHVEFWKELPFYAKDGAVFVVYSLKGGRQNGYENVG